MDQTPWTPDLLPNFEQSTLSGLGAPEGLVDTVLVRRRCASASSRAVLYIHGYVDYFFQVHLADFYNAAGLNFYALDLRRHGRAMRPHQHPNFTTDIDEYLQDVDAAIAVLGKYELMDWLLINGHSTGGLVAALYAHRGKNRSMINAVFLNSPFLDLNLPTWQKRFLVLILAAIGRWLPHLRLPELSEIYGQSLHREHHGQWDYNREWKPIAGFPIYAGWLRAIYLAHTEVAKGLAIPCPVLVLHAEQSTWPKQFNPMAMRSDTVLNVADIHRLAPGLGNHVCVKAVPDGIHDLTLSGAAPRQAMFEALGQWLLTVSTV
ncbi:MAG: alpha/beta hydrolase [Rhodoferax sp.]|jgi:alpha-beta hydrolase superfamily lysophospholipase|uniref:alpha/beta hydrolase n=1 Tax=Rhodoferax sp. TaxID=50421 RepID=UPI001B78BA42|nr:alpha/beta hydrolase [Rhodoferax sp.]MBP8285418.1 alpha/beta hydrolase [Rhodoferax sp.]MBP9735916.1 alpha/beta hydrolase [Rhodoferax sp.]MBP9906259.1 alpha/beta hydrolase [Rhodoferax sp.]